VAGGTAFQPNAFQTNAFQIAGGVTATELQVTIGIVQDDDTVSINLNLPAVFTGAGGKARRRRPLLVEIDEEVFEVASMEEAVALLEQAREEARKQADLVIERARKATKRPPRKVIADARKSLVLPEIKADTTISDMVQRITKEIEDLYRNALVTVEIGTLLKKQEEIEDDEETALLMLL
jgi:hypothetical protein